jgi:hypothetical protein
MADAKTRRWHQGKPEAWNGTKSLRTRDQSANQRRPLVVSAAAGAGLEFDE